MSIIAAASHLRQAPPAALTAGAAIDHSQLAKIAFERTRMPMVVADAQLPDLPIVFANEAFLEQTGYCADEVIGHNCRFLQGPKTDQAAVAQLREAIAAARDITIELLNYRRDGSTFWNRLMISPITDDDGRLLYFFASQLDVSEERRARDLAAREHVLLREIDHRAKNALALVQGIVRLTRADDATHYARSVQGRVEALAQAHILLSDAEWRDIALDRIVAVASAPFGSARTPRNGPAIDIAAAHVQPLILAFHELLTNAAQHGGLSSSAGAATMRWRHEDDSIVIDLTETGGPAPDAGAPPGFGLTMVDAFVRRQLRGNIERRWHCHGLTTELSFPHKHLAATGAGHRR